MYPPRNVRPKSEGRVPWSRTPILLSNNDEIKPYQLFEYTNNTIQFVNNWSIIYESIPDNYISMIDMNSNSINLTSIQEISVMIHNRIPTTNGLYYKAYITFVKTTLESIKRDIVEKDNIIQDNTISYDILFSVLINDIIIRFNENKDISVSKLNLTDMTETMIQQSKCKIKIISIKMYSFSN